MQDLVHSIRPQAGDSKQGTGADNDSDGRVLGNAGSANVTTLVPRNIRKSRENKD